VNIKHCYAIGEQAPAITTLSPCCRDSVPFVSLNVPTASISEWLTDGEKLLRVTWRHFTGGALFCEWSGRTRRARTERTGADERTSEQSRRSCAVIVAAAATASSAVPSGG